MDWMRGRVGVVIISEIQVMRGKRGILDLVIRQRFFCIESRDGLGRRLRGLGRRGGGSLLVGSRFLCLVRELGSILCCWMGWLLRRVSWI